MFGTTTLIVRTRTPDFAGAAKVLVSNRAPAMSSTDSVRFPIYYANEVIRGARQTLTRQGRQFALPILPAIHSALTTAAVPTRCERLWRQPSSGRPGQRGAFLGLLRCRAGSAVASRISPHRFRHCAASTSAVFAPSEIKTAVGVLDHSTPRPTHQHYILARGIEASRQYAKIVADQTPKRAGRSRRPQG